MKRYDILTKAVQLGLAVRDAGDGAWAWTATGKKALSDSERLVLSYLMYGDYTEDSLPRYLKPLVPDWAKQSTSDQHRNR